MSKKTSNGGEASPLAPASSPEAVGSSATPLSTSSSQNAFQIAGVERSKRISIAELIDRGIITAHKDGNYGSNYPKVEEFGPEGVLFLTAKLLDDSGNIDFDNAPRLASKKANKLTFGFVEKDDVLLSHNATIGRVAIVPDIHEKILIGTSLTFFRLNQNFLIPKYLSAFFSGIDFKNQLKSVMSQTTRNQVPITSQRSLSILLPSIEMQKSIAHILGTLDDKIELNRRINQTLEEMAQALFKSWFVDFDPVKAKASVLEAGGTPQQAEQAAMQSISGKSSDELESFKAAQPDAYAELAHTASLFPSRLSESELGPIPDGWHFCDLSEYADLNPESWSRKTRPDFVEYADLSNVKWGRIEAVTEYLSGDAPSRAQRVLRVGDTIVGTVRPGNGSYCMISRDGLTGSTGFAVLRCRKSEYREFVYLAATAAENIKRLTRLADGGAYPAVSPEMIIGTGVVASSDNLIRVFSSNVKGLFQKAGSIFQQNQDLSTLRDSLLPKLLSGELELPDELVDEAGVNS